MAQKAVDRPLLITVIILVVTGFFIFSSASLGLLAREGARFSQVAFSQLFLGIILGGLLLTIFSKLHYRILRKHALLIFILSLAVTLLVFVPGLGFEYGGAKRWIDLGLVSFQPAEFLKLGFVIYFAAWLSRARGKLHHAAHSILPFAILMAVVALVLLLQPDTSTLMIMGAAGTAMLIAAGVRIRHIAVLGAVGIAGIAALAQFRPYIGERFMSFLDPSIDPLGLSYQIQQSLIAVGSGQIFGRGFGQGVQKFDYLPEAIGDSIFAAFAEEFGFVGGVFLIALFLTLAFRGLRIAARAPDHFGGLLVVGIVILIVSQSFVNIASMIGVLPLTGLPLLFVSHGGSALAIALLEVGIVLNVSRYVR